MTQPIDINFNKAVQEMARRLHPDGYDLSANAPETLEGVTKYYQQHGRFCIFNGASEKTIFGCNKTNYDFRAWHDYHHLQMQAPFTLEGEIQVMEAQQRDIINLCGDASLPFTQQPERVKFWCKLLDIEVKGQVEFYLKNGYFIEDQMQFTKEKLRGTHHDTRHYRL